MQVTGTFPELSAGMKRPKRMRSGMSRMNKPRHVGKMSKVMGEFKAGTLHSGSKKGPKVSSRKQAIAIGLSEARKAGQDMTYDDNMMGGGMMGMDGGFSGFASSTKPRVLNNPKTLSGRRAASHSH